MTAAAPVDITVAEALDHVCEDLHHAPAWQLVHGTLHVHPRVYERIAWARRAELARGNPLVVLGLELQADDVVPPGEARFR